MAVRSIHHLGIAVAELDEAVATYERLFGARVEHRDRVPDQGVEAVSVLVGDSRVELLAPLGDETPVGRFLASRGPGMHHVAYEVEDVGAELERLRADGVELVDTVPRQGLFGLQVAFLHPDAAHGVLSELVSSGRLSASGSRSASTAGRSCPRSSTAPTWDELERQVMAGGPGGFPLEADEGRYVVALARVVYVKRFARESRVGFGTISGVESSG